uniref:ParB/RepB/Spo0J family partition protein n=1 Tax=Agathobacter sp. TaxID=2021311 RepID=UPI0040577B1A
MAKNGSASKIKIDSFDDLFGIPVAENSNQAEQVVEVSLDELHNFKNHPFRVLDDAKMEETVESIKKYGVLMPGIARPRKEGGYEIIAGHCRKRGSELAGKDTMPVFIRNYTDDEATIIMVDTNIQREDILPSEKAKAYSMKYEALKHQGKRDGGSTFETIGEPAGESGKTVQRYIRLAGLLDELLDMVDKKQLGFVQGVDISYLTEEQQAWIFEILSAAPCVISKEQAASLKEYAKSGELTKAVVQLILCKKKEKDKRITIKRDKIHKYFPESYSNKEIEDVIYQLLEEWKNKN